MNSLILLFANLLLICQEPDSLISTPNIKAFTHPQFFFSQDCECSRFNSNFLWFDIYKSPTNSIFPYMRADEIISSILPPDFETGYSVIITGKQGDYFRIKFNEEENPVDSQCEDCDYYVKKGTLGTWVKNYNDATDEYMDVPLYEKPTTNAKIIVQLKQEDSVVIVLDVDGKWMFVETISSKKEKKRGWLDPKMQFGNPYGTH